MAQNTKIARSPYAKYQKGPYRYSENYERWNKAVGLAGAGIETEEAHAADAAFRKANFVPQVSLDFDGRATYYA